MPDIECKQKDCKQNEKGWCIECGVVFIDRLGNCESYDENEEE